MLETVRVHTVVHLKCLQRNRVALGFALVVTIALASYVLPGLILTDDTNRFEALRDLALTLHRVVGLGTAGVGLLLLWTHRRARSIKLVATSASPFEAWVGSLFVTAALTGIAAQAFVAGIVYGLSLCWNVTYQYGFLYLPLDRFVESLIALGVITAVSAALHPVLTVMVVTVVSDTLAHQLRLGLDGLPDGPGVRLFRGVAAGLYYAVPAMDPFGEHTSGFLRSMRVTSSDWRYLAWSVAYALLVTALGWCATVAVLRRRSLV